jgi:type IV secretory pathway VirB6-like protein
MYLMQKITKILSLVFLITLLASCTKTGCILPEELDTEAVVVQANPTSDGVTGTYNSNNGGQRANWHDTGLKTNGAPFLIKISGGWSPWGGDVTQLQRCDFCAIKDPAVSTALGQPVINNCICYDNNGIDSIKKREAPSPEDAPNGTPRNVDCNIAANQNDPAQCSCTRQNGKVTDYGVYHIPLNYQDKNGVTLVPDLQSTCKYDRGMGLYLGLFGGNGAIQPTRLYHLFSQEEICDIGRDSNNKCLDMNGNDATQYVFRSANYAASDPLVKDDKHNNDGSYVVSPRDSNVDYHTPNEEIKVMIYDRYYSDNSGSYTLTFLGGINGGSTDNGIIEYLVKIVEDSVLGTLDKNGVRQGGLIQFFFNSIVNDSSFITILQLSLSFYILFFGVGTLIGVIEINRKELMSRIVKIGLVIFFITPTGWYFYNEIIVKFFQDGMNSVISMFMSMSDVTLDQSTSSQIVIAQMNGNGNFSNSLRFAYPDIIIRYLVSGAAALKIWSLLFSNAFGWMYIILFYLAVAGFIAVMLYAATVYLLAILKLSFVLALGPIFICFTLFAHTNEMFKKWLAFLGARSLEIVFLFLVLYNFLYILDQAFTHLLYFEACYTPLFSTTPAFAESANPFQMIVLKAKSDKSFVQWIIAFIKIGGLIFILKLIIDKMPHVAQSLIDIGGGGSGTSGHGASDEERSEQGGGMGSSAALARQIFGSIGSLAEKAAIKAAPYAAAGAAGAAGGISRVGAAIGGAFTKATGISLPPGPIEMARNAMIGSEIAKATQSADAQGLSGREREQAIRSATLQAVQTNNSKSGALAGISTESALKMLDKKLVAEPLRAKIKEFAKQLKQGDPANIPFGKNMEDQIKALANQWADGNLLGGRDAIKGHLQNLKGFMAKQGELSTDEAAKKFANNPEMQNKYLQHLKDREFTKAQEKQRADNYRPFATDTIDKTKTGIMGTIERAVDKSTNFVSSKILNPIAKADAKASNAVGRAVDAVKGDVINNPKSAAASFIRKSKYAEERNNDIWAKFGIDSNKGFNPFRASTYTSRINAIDKDSPYFRNQDFLEKGQKADRLHALNYGIGGGYEQELKQSEKQIEDRYDQQLAEYKKNEIGDYATKRLKAKEKEKIQEEIDKIRAKKYHFFGALKKEIEKKLLEKEDPTAPDGSKMLKTTIDEIKPYLKTEAQRKREEKQWQEQRLDRFKEVENIKETYKKDGKSNKEINNKINERRSSYIQADKKLADPQKAKLEREAHKKAEEIIKNAESEYSKKALKADQTHDNTDLTEALKSKVELEYLRRELKIGPSTPTDIALESLTPLTLDLTKQADLDKLTKIPERLEKVNKDLDELKIDEKLESLGKDLKDGKITSEDYNKALEQLMEQKQALIITEFKVEFGASVSDVLLKELDIGLKAPSLLPGAPDAERTQALEVAKTAFAAQKSQCDCKLRMTKIDKKIKQMEKYNLESALKSASEDEKKAIGAKLAEIENSLKAIEREETTIDDQISELNNTIDTLKRL